MKKDKGVIIIIFFAIIIILGCIALKNLRQKIEPSPQELLEIVKPEINDYCNILEGNAIYSTCPTCMYYHPLNKDESYVYVEALNESDYRSHEYIIEKVGDYYQLTMQLQLIYGRNDRPGRVIILFKVNERGDIIDEDLPIKECL